MKAYLLKPDGTKEDIESPENGEAYEYPQLKKLLVAAGIDIFQICKTKTPELMMLIDDCGKLMGMETNLRASAMYLHYPHDYIVGPALIIPTEWMQ